MAGQDSGSSQEPSRPQETTAIDATALELQDKLRLNSTAPLNPSSHESTITTAAAPLFSSPSMDPGNKCSSTKRQSPSSWWSHQETSSKRATIRPLSSPTTTSSGDHRFPGFNELRLPTAFPNPLSSSSSPAHQRATSEQVISFEPSSLADQAPTSLGSSVNNQLTESSLVNTVATSPSGPLGPLISGTASASYQAVTTNTPPRPTAARKITYSPSTGEAGLNLKEALKGFKDGLRAFTQFCNVATKEVAEDAVSDSQENEDLSKDKPEVSPVTGSEEGPCQEPVWEESGGECLILHFKCRCGKGYEILLTGKSCYYKLTDF